jgi:transposase
MIVPSLGVKVLIAMKPTDFRKGMDGLAALVRETLGANPYGGVIYVFRSKRSDRVKLLFWDGTGLVLAIKRLEQGSFRWPVPARGSDATHAGATLGSVGGARLDTGARGSNAHADGGLVMSRLCGRIYILQATPAIDHDSVRPCRRRLIRFPTTQAPSRRCSSPRRPRTSV